MIQAVIFDWAGTTVDYGCFAPVQAFQEAFAHHGVPVTLEETPQAHGHAEAGPHPYHAPDGAHRPGLEETHGRPAGEEDVEAVYAQFEPKLFSILDQFSTPKPFAVETAAALREMGPEDRLHHRLYRFHDAHCCPRGCPAGLRPRLLDQPRRGGRQGPPLSLHDF